MKKYLYTIAFLLVAFVGQAQSKQEHEVVERTYQLSHTVFGSKDSMAVEDLFASKATYGHSSGKIETRREAIDAIVQNKASYTDTALNIINVVLNGNTAVVRTGFKASQKNPDGNASPLNLHIMLVWVKEKGKWRLMGRQAVKVS